MKRCYSNRGLLPLMGRWFLLMLFACMVPLSGYGENTGAQIRRRADANLREARMMDQRADALRDRGVQLKREARRRQEQARQGEARRRSGGTGVRSIYRAHDSWTPLYQEAGSLGQQERQLRNRAAALTRQSQDLYRESRRLDGQAARRRSEEAERRYQETLENERQRELARRQQQEYYHQTGGIVGRTIRPGTCFIDSASRP